MYDMWVASLQPGMEDGRNCYADEHYLPTLFNVSIRWPYICWNLSSSLILWHIWCGFICMKQMMDPHGISNWSVTHVDWSEGKWHPKAYRAQDVSYELLKNITVCFCLLFYICLSCIIMYTTVLTPIHWSCLQSIDMSHHVTSDSQVSSLCIFTWHFFAGLPDTRDDEEKELILDFFSLVVTENWNT
jgi:hypothetical protein